MSSSSPTSATTGCCFWRCCFPTKESQKKSSEQTKLISVTQQTFTSSTPPSPSLEPIQNTHSVTLSAPLKPKEVDFATFEAEEKEGSSVNHKTFDFENAIQSLYQLDSKIIDGTKQWQITNILGALARIHKNKQSLLTKIEEGTKLTWDELPITTHSNDNLKGMIQQADLLFIKLYTFHQQKNTLDVFFTEAFDISDICLEAICTGLSNWSLKLKGIDPAITLSFDKTKHNTDQILANFFAVFKELEMRTFAKTYYPKATFLSEAWEDTSKKIDFRKDFHIKHIKLEAFKQYIIKTQALPIENEKGVKLNTDTLDDEVGKFWKTYVVKPK